MNLEDIRKILKEVEFFKGYNLGDVPIKFINDVFKLSEFLFIHESRDKDNYYLVPYKGTIIKLDTLQKKIDVLLDISINPFHSIKYKNLLDLESGKKSYYGDLKIGDKFLFKGTTYMIIQTMHDQYRGSSNNVYCVPIASSVKDIRLGERCFFHIKTIVELIK